jgi:hypothetical protein
MVTPVCVPTMHVLQRNIYYQRSPSTTCRSAVGFQFWPLLFPYPVLNIHVLNILKSWRRSREIGKVCMSIQLNIVSDYHCLEYNALYEETPKTLNISLRVATNLSDVGLGLLFHASLIILFNIYIYIVGLSCNVVISFVIYGRN